MEHVFISYVREDEGLANLITNAFRANGVPYWLDRESIAPGVRWEAAIREAIRKGSRFLSLHSKRSAAKIVSGANEELVLAIDEIRKRPHDAVWFIPWKNDETPIPDRSIGGGERLSDLHWINASELGWREAMRRLLVACGVDDPVLDPGEPLSSALPASVAVRGGSIEYQRSSMPLPGFDGTIYTVTGGVIRRDDQNGIVARLMTQAGHRKVQEFNERVGMDDIFAYADASCISENPTQPTRFLGRRSGTFSEGEVLFHPGMGEVRLPTEVRFEATFEAIGALQGSTLSGLFKVTIDSSMMGVNVPQTQQGVFEVTVEPHR